MSKLYQKLFAQVYDGIMSPAEKKLVRRRKYLLAELSGKILDVGGGTGANLKFYSKNAEVMLVDPSQAMIQKAKKKLKENTATQFLTLGINDDELQKHIAPNSLDAVVCTLVLCTIPNPNLAIKNFKNWLKPTGKLVVLEHICSDNSFHKTWQNAVNPFWKKLGDGCNLNRSTDNLIKANGFNKIEEDYFGGTIQFYQGIFSQS